MKKIILLFIIISLPIYGQELQLPPTSQYLADNPYVIAGAYAGIGDFYKLRFTGETQWLGVKDAPQTQSLSFDVRIGDRSGLGAILFNDKNRNTSQKGGQITYAHHITLSEYNNQFISFGLSYKFTNFNIDASDIVTSDPSVQSYNVNNSNFDLSFLYRLENFFISFNAANILDKTIKPTILKEPTNIRNYYLYTGFLLKNKFTSLEYEPSILYQLYESDGRSSLDLNLKIRKMNGSNYIWAGISARLLADQSFKPNSIAPLVGFRQNKLYAAYSFNISLNQLQSHNSGTHMITIGLDFSNRISNCKCVN
ncbi:type IX secretion system membrane protein PorP/SprF [Flavobacterium sp. LS1R47]|uniref:Type IX secretion system membrane protein PorP/SprF n=1 Tax=Flavobacterium frigoritolerans TaxID=2987686 RepID=A0A9X3HMX6_9FLAO|nr:type IX secretion system membrane protein PorP/SprF [Flavobacterium frigoritolerans]MCV9934295.1 type IX secretion system membrane protein PorP/SprF [Flavobacterium frigoritolerans]